LNVYVDSSVALRIALSEAYPLRMWHRITRSISSELTRVECLRTVDRARVRFALNDESVAQQRASVIHLLDRIELYALDNPVMNRAAEPFPTTLGALDALHLATALILRPHIDELRFATHDRELATAARSVGFEVLA
jgi:predicted nucleic acid-binding protein